MTLSSSMIEALRSIGVHAVAEPLVRLHQAGRIDLASALRKVVPPGSDAAYTMAAEDLTHLLIAVAWIEPVDCSLNMTDGVLCGDAPLGNGHWVSCRADEMNVFVRDHLPETARIAAAGRTLRSVVAIPPLDDGGYVILRVSPGREQSEGALLLLTCTASSLNVPVLAAAAP